MSERIDRTERLLNLVIGLMASPVPMSRAQIQRQIPGYADSASATAFERMFERDKDELRSMGIPVDTVTDASGEVLGYRIPQDRYALEDLALSLEERAAVAVAAQVWGQAVMAPTAGTALRKLESTTGEPDTWGPAGLRGSIQLTTSDGALLPLMAAIRQDRAVRFSYRTPSDTAALERHVSPWGLRLVGGNWTLVGHDHDRAAVRTFRLSRIDGPVTVESTARTVPPPEDFDVATGAGAEPGDDQRIRARLRVRPGRGATLRRRAVASGDTDPWTAEEIVVEGGSVEEIAALVCGAGADAVALEPSDVVDAVRVSLDRVAAMHEVTP